MSPARMRSHLDFDRQMLISRLRDPAFREDSRHNRVLHLSLEPLSELPKVGQGGPHLGARSANHNFFLDPVSAGFKPYATSWLHINQGKNEMQP